MRSFLIISGARCFMSKTVPVQRIPSSRSTIMGSFTDHSSNERTFLAWLRTGIAVVAFGFVVEKFNLFITALGSTNSELGEYDTSRRAYGAAWAL